MGVCKVYNVFKNLNFFLNNDNIFLCSFILIFLFVIFNIIFFMLSFAIIVTKKFIVA